MKGIKLVGMLALTITVCTACQQMGSTDGGQKIGITVIQAQDGTLYDGNCVVEAVAQEKSISDCPKYQVNTATMGTPNPALLNADFTKGLVAEKCNCNYNNWWSYYNNPTSYSDYYAVYDPYYVPASTFGSALGYNSYSTSYFYNQLGYNSSTYNINSFGYPGYNYSNFAYTPNYNQGYQWWNYYWWL